MKELTGDPLGAFSAVVIEAKADKWPRPGSYRIGEIRHDWRERCF